MYLTVAGKSYGINHPLIVALNELYHMQVMLSRLPKSWSDFSPRDFANQLLGYISRMIHSSDPRTKQPFIEEILSLMETQMDFIYQGNTDIDLMSTELTGDFLLLHSEAQKLRSALSAAHEFISLESKSVSENLLYALNIAVEAVDKFCTWLWRFALAYSCDENGSIPASSLLKLWDHEKIKSLHVE